MPASPESQASSRPWPARLPFSYGWVMLPAAAIALFASGPGQTFTVSVFVDSFIEEFGWSRTTVSGLYTAGSLTAAATMFGVGRLLDRYGARVMLTIVGSLMGLALVWMSTVDTQAELYAGFTALRILGQGSLTLIPTTLVAIWFVRGRGRATALAGLGMVASQAVFPPLAQRLIASDGWRDAWFALAIVVWVVLMPVAILLIRRSPESVGVTIPGLAPEQPEATGRQADWTLRHAMGTPAFWLLLIAGSSQSLISTALVFHQADILSTRGLDAAVSAAVLSVMGPASFAGVLSAGFLADRYSNRHLLALSQGMLIGAMLLVMWLGMAWQALVYGAVAGFASGFAITISTVIWPNYYGRAHLGSIRGVATTGMVAAAALGPLPLSIGLDVAGSYAAVIGVAMALPLASAVMALAATRPRLYRRSIHSEGTSP